MCINVVPGFYGSYVLDYFSAANNKFLLSPCGWTPGQEIVQHITHCKTTTLFFNLLSEQIKQLR